MADFTAIADKLDVIEVCTRIHWCYDHEDWEGLDTLFADTVAMPTLAQVSEPGFELSTYLGRYQLTREEVKRALRTVKEGLTTQHLIAGHQVALNGDKAVCLAHSVNVHLPSGSSPGDGLLAHGNDYRFDLLRTEDGWRVCGWVPEVRWSYGDESVHNATAKQEAWLRRENA